MTDPIQLAKVAVAAVAAAKAVAVEEIGKAVRVEIAPSKKIKADSNAHENLLISAREMLRAVRVAKAVVQEWRLAVVLSVQMLKFF